MSVLLVHAFTVKCMQQSVEFLACCIMVIRLQACTQDIQSRLKGMVPAAPWCPHTRYKSCVDLAGSLESGSGTYPFCRT